MSDLAIHVDGVTKCYRRFTHSHRFLTLKSAFVGGNPFNALSPNEIFTALDGVSFEVGAGETFGVIGGNGAGKSTLLKIIAGTTKPTEGKVWTRGKISALIELGAGFHPEISGRENVFINGIMLGLSRKEMAERFDQIVRFAELEDFIDSPVKTYSSGMYMRLGFSVAIHVEPEILLIDEVLAVGDVSFVHKCLDKIGEFKRRGRTILLVTHGMETVRSLCDRALWLQNGETRCVGDPPRVVDEYLQWVSEHEERDLTSAERRRRAAFEDDESETIDGPTETETEESAPYEPGRWGDRAVVIDEVRLLGADKQPRHVFSCGEAVIIELRVKAEQPVDDFVFGVGIFNASGVNCYGTNTDIERYKPESLSGVSVVRVALPELSLLPGTYYLDVAAHRKDGSPYDYQRGLHKFRMTSRYTDAGIVRLPHAWEFSGGVRWRSQGGIAQG